jgi:hypothetical protein
MRGVRSGCFVRARDLGLAFEDAGVELELGEDMVYVRNQLLFFFAWW